MPNNDNESLSKYIVYAVVVIVVVGMVVWLAYKKPTKAMVEFDRDSGKFSGILETGDTNSAAKDNVDIEASTVEGEITAVIATDNSGERKVKMKIDTIKSGGKVVGVDHKKEVVLE